ncbi:MAG: dethiobiotin synthase [Candidatus Cloacimonadota bacterium]|nr:MAG: dethiobiotin synthase [Candidatus Cloacimonadota bacterium]
MKKYFVSGIDTDVGKTYVTGILLKYLKSVNCNSLSIKPIQTGCKGISEDILLHRKISKSELTTFDEDLTTSPYVFKFPASPHLSSELEKIKIDSTHIEKSINKVAKSYDITLIEGAGGLFVPFFDTYTTIDFLKSNRDIGVILVTTPKLGSINHTLLSLYTLKNENIKIEGIIYNKFGDYDKVIAYDTFEKISQFIEKWKIDSPFIEVSDIEGDYNFSKIFKG